jgi:hypothetical protein
LQFKSYTKKNTLSVDGFLYEEEDIDDLCDAGKLSRNYCLGIEFLDEKLKRMLLTPRRIYADCGSHRTQPLNFVSHSLSIPELKFIFKQVL